MLINMHEEEFSALRIVNSVKMMLLVTHLIV